MLGRERALEHPGLATFLYHHLQRTRRERPAQGYRSETFA